MRKWINLCEDAEPTLVYDSGEGAWIFNGYGVSAEMLGDPHKGVNLYTMSSAAAGQGNGEKALRWLKQRCPIIHVSDPGEPESDSYGFWQNMFQKGLIDSAEDDEGNEVNFNA